jgi:ADP-heptose:LPS heptosyltransferase
MLPLLTGVAWRSKVIGATSMALGLAVPRHAAPGVASVRRVVVVKPASLGDVILASPAVATLRLAFPRAHVSLAVGRWSLPAAHGIPGPDAVLDLGNFGTPGRFGPRDLPAAVRVIRRGKYDLAVVLDRSPLVAVAPLLAGVPWRVGIDSAGRGFAHGIRVPWAWRCHEADLYLQVAQAATSRARASDALPVPALAFEPGAEARAAADAYWHEVGLDGASSPVVVVHPGGGSNPGTTMNAKRWAPDRFGAVARALVGAGNRVVLVGDRNDATTVAAVMGSIDAPMVNLSGRPTLATLAALIGRADAYLGNDSVPLHLAVAMGTPAVALYGPTDPRVYGPYAPKGGPYSGRGIGLVSPDACSQRRPFRPGPIEACAGCRCIDLVEPTDVVRAVSGLTAMRRDARRFPPA